MPNIPITDIPNLSTPGAPTLSPQMGGVPSVQGVNVGGAQLDGGGLGRARSLLAEASANRRQGNQTLARVIEGGKQDQVSAAPFMAEFAGLAEIGQAFQVASAATERWASQVAEARDTVALAEASTIMNQAFDAHRAEIESGKLSETEWVPKWQKDVMPAVAEKLRGITASAQAQSEIAASWMKFSGETTGQFAVAATKKSFDIAQGKVLNSAEISAQNGHWEEAQGIIQRGIQSGLIRQDVGEAKMNDLMQAAQDDQTAKLIQSNPKAIIDQPELLGDMPEAKRQRIVGQAQQQLRVQQADATDAADLSIYTGEFTTPEQIAKFGEDNDLPADVIRSLQNSLAVTVANTPEAQAQMKANRSALSTEVANFTYSDENAYYALADKIRTSLPEGQRDELLDDLRKSRDTARTPSQQIKGSLFAAIDKLGEQGLVYDTKGIFDDKGNVINGRAEDYMKFIAKKDELKAFVTDELKKNPQATAEEMRQKFQQRISSEVKGGADIFSKPKQGGGWFNWFGANSRPMAPASAGLANALPASQASATNTANISPKNIPASKLPIANKIVAAAAQTGLSPTYMLAMAMQESGLNPATTVPGASAKGLFGMLNEDRRAFKVGAGVDEDIRGGIEKTKQNLAAAVRAVGRPPTDGELYVVHYQGIGAGPEILKNPGASFRDTLNKFGRNWYGTVIKANPWLSEIRTNQDFIDWATDKIERRKKQLGIS